MTVKGLRLIIDLHGIEENTRTLVKQCSAHGIQVAGVTKMACGNPTIAASLVESGVHLLADARVENLANLKEFAVPKMLLRIPMVSQAAEVVHYADISMVSETHTAKALSDEAMKQDKQLELLLMLDMGDRREGIHDEKEIVAAARTIQSMPGIILRGVATNLSCFNGVRPVREHLERLVFVRNMLRAKLHLPLDMVSGGNSATLPLLREREIPNEVNQLRLGASLLMGIGLDDLPISGLRQDLLRLEAEVVEVRVKPSKPEGETGLNSFGEKKSVQDRGMRRRAVCAVGRQDVAAEEMIPLMPGVEILGDTSDHLVLDVTEAGNSVSVGDILGFHLTYGGCLSAMTSPYVEKRFVSVKECRTADDMLF